MLQLMTEGGIAEIYNEIPITLESNFIKINVIHS
jgi:hypothetical protein